MKEILSTISKIVRFVFTSLTPLAAIISIIVVVGSSLLIYDQIQTYNDRKLGAELIKNLKADSSCSKTAKAGDKFDLSVTFTNGNTAAINLQAVQIEKTILGTTDKKFIWLVASSPPFSAIGTSTTQYLNYNFENLTVKSKSSLPISLTLQASDRKTAGAKPHTFVIYSGKLVFDFEHGMTIEAPCEIQVVYAE